MSKRIPNSRTPRAFASQPGRCRSSLLSVVILLLGGMVAYAQTPTGPPIDFLSPSTIQAGGPSFTLTVNGYGFTGLSNILWNGTELPTTMLTPAQCSAIFPPLGGAGQCLSATVPANLIDQPGTAAISLNTNGYLSNSLSFTITPAPSPTISSLSPSTAQAGGPAFTLTVNGSGFSASSVVLWNGGALQTTFVSAGQLTALVGTTLTGSPGTATVTVSNSGSISNSVLFQITAATGPIIQTFVSLPSVTPSMVNLTGDPGQTIAVKAAVSVGYTPPDSTMSDPNTAPLPNEVNLLLVHADGTETVIATLNDNGTDGDLAAGDGIYSGTAVLSVSQANNGLISLVASAVFPVEPQSVTSSVAVVQLFPANVPLGMPPQSVNTTCADIDGNPFMCSELLLFTQPGNDYPEVSIFAGSVGGTVTGVLTFPHENIWMIELRPDLTGQNVLSDVSNFRGSQTLRAVQADYLAFPDGVTPNDPYFVNQWGVKFVNLDKAWAITTGDFIGHRDSPSSCLAP